MEGIFNFGPKVASFLLTSGSQRWYAVGKYVPPHNTPAIHCINKALEVAPKGMEAILLEDINVRLRELYNNREDELTLAMAGSGLGDVTSHFTPRRRYRGTGNWTWKTRREVSLVTGRGDYILISDRDDFFKSGVQEARLYTDH